VISSSSLEEVFIPDNENEKGTKAGKKLLFFLDNHDYRILNLMKSIYSITLRARGLFFLLQNLPFLIFQVFAQVLSYLVNVMKLIHIFFMPASGRVDEDDDDDDDNEDRSISEGVHGKTAICGIALKDEYPSSSVATQQNSKFTNAVVDTVKRKFPFSLSDIDTSSDDSSDDSFIDNLPISSAISRGKTTKM
jgi:hypothetical protein